MTETIYGKITSIDYANRNMLVKDNGKNPIIYPLKWEEVLDVVCTKQKPGYRVKVTTIPKGDETYIKELSYDDTFKGNKNSYAGSSETDKKIMLQSCMRTGATVFGITSFSDPLNPVTFDDAMDQIISRAIKDTATLMAEAKKE